MLVASTISIGLGSFFTPMAGWAITGRPLTAPVVDACVGFGFLFATLYPMTQIYQVAEDSARGDQTLVIRMGVGSSLNYALGALVGTLVYLLLTRITTSSRPSAS